MKSFYLLLFALLLWVCCAQTTKPCQVTKWTRWSKCSGVCGSQIRRRAIIDNVPRPRILECEEPKDIDTGCPHTEEIRICRWTKACQSRRCIMSPWSQYDEWFLEKETCANRPRYSWYLQGNGTTCPKRYEYAPAPNPEVNPLWSADIYINSLIKNSREFLTVARESEAQAVETLEAARAAKNPTTIAEATQLLSTIRSTIQQLLKRLEQLEVTRLEWLQDETDYPNGKSPLASLMFEKVDEDTVRAVPPQPNQPPITTGDCAYRPHSGIWHNCGKDTNLGYTKFRPRVVAKV
eukprot:TRINITY_DN1957_c0_g1_i1.p1 TRINITY_DN1957_c0_g1~~TRINITY_DN1957_c0_g1_i1.p1  ORF type:complete len:320 (-),score=65.93 TRINITY_DN1957_c0_g1_i1:93-971(-)